MRFIVLHAQMRVFLLAELLSKVALKWHRDSKLRKKISLNLFKLGQTMNEFKQLSPEIQKINSFLDFFSIKWSIYLWLLSRL